MSGALLSKVTCSHPTSAFMWYSYINVEFDGEHFATVRHEWNNINVDRVEVVFVVGGTSLNRPFEQWMLIAEAVEAMEKD